MHVVEVLEGRRQLRHDCRGVRQIHAADVVALEHVDEALGHAVTLRAADRRCHWLEAQRASNRADVASDVLPMEGIGLNESVHRFLG